MQLFVTVQKGRSLGRLPEQIKAAAEVEMENYALGFEVELKKQIMTPKWDIGTFTRWSGGKPFTIEPPSDIVDSGELRDSLFVFEAAGRYGKTFEIGSSAPYASAVRFGYWSERSQLSKATKPFRSRFIEGRDFVASALEAQPLPSFLRQARLNITRTVNARQ